METPAKGEKKNAVDFTERLKEESVTNELNRSGLGVCWAEGSTGKRL